MNGDKLAEYVAAETNRRVATYDLQCRRDDYLIAKDKAEKARLAFRDAVAAAAGTLSEAEIVEASGTLRVTARKFLGSPSRTTGAGTTKRSTRQQEEPWQH